MIATARKTGWELVVQHRGLMYRACSKAHIPIDLQDEAVSDACIPAVLRAAESYDPAKGKISTYLMRGMYFALNGWKRDSMRRHSREMLASQGGDLMEAQYNGTPAHRREQIEWERTESQAAECLLTLGALDRKIVYARFWEKRSLRQIGQQLGYSRQGIQNRIKAALAKMRK